MAPAEKDCSTVCRICLSGETSVPSTGTSAGEPLISPCRCKGTMGLYHRSCLETWLSHSKTLTCEICKYAYRVQRPGFFAFLKSRRPFEQHPSGIFSIEAELIIAVVGITISALLVYACIKIGEDSIFIQRDDDQGVEYEKHVFFWIVLVLFTLLFLYCIGYKVVVGIYYQHKYFKKWQMNQRLGFFQRSRNQSVLRETAIDINPELVETARQASPINQSFSSYSSFSSIPLEPVARRTPLALSTFRRDLPGRMIPLHHSTPAVVIAESPIYDDPGVFYPICLSPVSVSELETTV